MILPYRAHWPKIHETAFVAPSADIIGDVEVGAHSSIWFQCVIRGDVNHIRIGNNTNVQDHSMLHVTRAKCPLYIGDEVTIGHRVTLHGCRIGNRILVGMGAIILDDVEVGDECLIGAGALITQRTKIPPRSLVLGSPAKVVRTLTAEELAFLPKSAANYVADAIEYRGYVPSPKRMGANNADLESFSSSFDDREGFEREGYDREPYGKDSFNKVERIGDHDGDQNGDHEGNHDKDHDGDHEDEGGKR